MARTRGVAQLLLLQLVVSFRPDAAPRRPLPARALRGERDDTTAASAKLIEKFISSRPADPAAASRSRRFRFRASARAKTAVREDATRTLTSYMTLPLDNYTLLDERFVARTADGFRLALPLGELALGDRKPLAGLDATAECDLTVASDAARRTNTITGSSFRIRVADVAALEQLADVDQSQLARTGMLVGAQPPANATPADKAAWMQQAMAKQQAAVSSMSEAERDEARASSLRMMSRGLAAADLEVSGAAALSWGAARAGANTTLRCKLALDVGVTLPPPLAYAPRVLLNPFGSLLLRLTWSRILPAVLALLRADYDLRWVRGQTNVSVTAPGGLLGTAALIDAEIVSDDTSADNDDDDGLGIESPPADDPASDDWVEDLYTFELDPADLDEDIRAELERYRQGGD